MISFMKGDAQMGKAERLKAFMKKYWAAVWVTAVIVCAVSWIAFAEYDSNKNREKRVAANVSSGGQMFSSDYLEKDTPVHRVPFSGGTDGYCTIPVQIWNFSTSNPGKGYPAVLPYTLTASLVERVIVPAANEGEQDTVAYNEITDSSLDVVIKLDDQNITWVQSQSAYVLTDSTNSFTADQSGNYPPATKVHDLKFPESLLAAGSNVYVRLEAVPTNGDTNLKPLSGIFGITSAAEALEHGWAGYFSDSKTYNDYDAFNYVFSGSGTATIDFWWCSDYLEVSQISLDKYNDPTVITSAGTTMNNVTGTWKKITLSADSDVLNRYDFQLDMTGDPTSDYTDPAAGENESPFWKRVESYVYKTIT